MLHAQTSCLPSPPFLYGGGRRSLENELESQGSAEEVRTHTSTRRKIRVPKESTTATAKSMQSHGRIFRKEDGEKFPDRKPSAHKM